MSVYVGYKQAGLLGALMGAAGMCAPSGVLMLIVALCLLQLKELPAMEGALAAVRPAVVGLLVWTAYDLGAKALQVGNQSWGELMATNWDKVLIVMAVAIGVTRFAVHPALVILAAALFGAVVYR
jgi:chromate transporter